MTPLETGIWTSKPRLVFCPASAHLLVDNRVKDDSCDHMTYFHCSLTLFSASLHSQKCIFSFNKGVYAPHTSTLIGIPLSLSLCEVVSGLFLLRASDLRFPRAENYTIPADISSRVFHMFMIVWFHLDKPLSLNAAQSYVRTFDVAP